MRAHSVFDTFDYTGFHHPQFEDKQLAADYHALLQARNTQPEDMRRRFFEAREQYLADRAEDEGVLVVKSMQEAIDTLQDESPGEFKKVLKVLAELRRGD